MSALADRLRDLVRPRGDGTAGGAAPPADGRHVPAASREARDGAADVLGGEWQEAGAHRFLVVDRIYRPGHRHGGVVLADALPPADAPWPGLSLLAGGTPPRGDDGAGGARVLFVDLETTGLAGGAGTCAFLVGCAWFDGGILRVRQLFLASAGAEPALLATVADLAAAAGMVVTYNGKSFDLPLIETRFLYHRMETPFAGMPHLDLLHPARRLWRSERHHEGYGRGHEGHEGHEGYGGHEGHEGHEGYGRGHDGHEGHEGYGRGHEGHEGHEGYGRGHEGHEGQGGCRLTTIERRLCGFVREGDVPGFEIPSRYFEYVRTGNPRPLAAVFEHNRLDLVSLALLTARAARLVEEGAEGTRTLQEALGLGRLYERAGRLDEALACYRRAAGTSASGGPPQPPAGPAAAAALRAYAVLSRRLRRHEEAAAAWRRLLELRSCPPQLAREAAQALAVHHEHRLRDPYTARALARRSLAQPAGPAWRQAIQHRIARLDRKIGIRGGPEPMF
jgi:uncharacterized protein YprB with RNaseH-like and TPR domain